MDKKLSFSVGVMVGIIFFMALRFYHFKMYGTPFPLGY